MLDLPVVWADDVPARTCPDAEIWVGVRTPAPRCPSGPPSSATRSPRPGARWCDARPHGDEVLRARARHRTSGAPRGRLRRSGRRPASRDRARTASCRTSSRPRRCSTACPAPPVPPRSTPGPGRYCYDTMTLVGPGTWARRPGRRRRRADRRRPGRGGRAGGLRDLPPARPPRHPGRLRRLLLPQQRRRRGRRRCARRAWTGSRSSTSTPTTATAPQALFYDRADVFYGSVHVDPGAGWFPHYVGLRRRDRHGRRRGREPQRPARRRAPATRAGSPGWPRLCARRRRSGRTRWCCRSASTRPPTTRRARCGSPRRLPPRRARSCATWACRWSRCTRAATTCRPSAR